jgi:hypothetical protein
MAKEERKFLIQYYSPGSTTEGIKKDWYRTGQEVTEAELRAKILNNSKDWMGKSPKFRAVEFVPIQVGVLMNINLTREDS